MMNQADLSTYTLEIAQKVIETEEDFIFRTIMPFCEAITDRKISKQYLTNALLKYERLEAENERLRAKLAEIQKLSKFSDFTN